MILNALLSLYSIILGGSLSGLTFNIVIMSLWKSDIPFSRVKYFSKLFEFFIRKRSMHGGLLKFLKQIGSSFRALVANQLMLVAKNVHICFF